MARLSNFESLRIVSILLILSIHIYSQVPYREMSEINQLLGHFINAIGNIGVSCFILISGYFGIKFNAYRFIQIALLTTIYTIFIHIINHGWEINMALIRSAFTIPLYHNWFITCYLILMLLSPFINKSLEHISQNKFKKFLLIQFIIFSIIPTLFNTPYYTVLTGGGKCLVYFIFVYMVGRYIYFFNDTQVKRLKCIRNFLLMIFLICLLNIIAEMIFNKRCLIYAMDCSPFILISTISVFYLFKSFTFQSKWINYFSSSILAVYLLDGLRLFLDTHMFHLSTMKTHPLMGLLLFVEVISTFFFAVAIDKTRILLLGSLENKIINKVIKSYKWLYSKIIL